MTTTFDMAAMRAAHHDNDPDRLADFYADDAVIRLVDQTHPPSNPLEFKGRAAIREYLADICSRDMTHEIEDAIVGEGDMVAWTTACRYSSGERVLASETARVRDGRIVEDTIVQAWDA